MPSISSQPRTRLRVKVTFVINDYGPVHPVLALGGPACSASLKALFVPNIPWTRVFVLFGARQTALMRR